MFSAFSNIHLSSNIYIYIYNCQTKIDLILIPQDTNKLTLQQFAQNQTRTVYHYHSRERINSSLICHHFKSLLGGEGKSLGGVKKS